MKINGVEIDGASVEQLADIIETLQSRQQIVRRGFGRRIKKAADIVEKDTKLELNNKKFEQIELPISTPKFSSKSEYPIKMYEFLNKAGEPKHVDHIIKGISGKCTAKFKSAICGMLSYYTNKNKVFKRHKRGFYSVIYSNNNSDDSTNILCNNKNARKYPAICGYCGTNFLGRTKDAKYCSRAHMGKVVGLKNLNKRSVSKDQGSLLNDLDYT